MRVYDDEKQRYKQLAIGKADDTLDSNGETILNFKEAQTKALEFLKKSPSLNQYTVTEAAVQYLKWYKQNRKSYDETKASIEAHILPHFGKKIISDLRTREIKQWHEKLACKPARIRTSKYGKQKYRDEAFTDEQKRARKCTANRILTVFKAILNKAFQDEFVDSDLAWKRAKPFDNVDAPKIRFLKQDECVRLINACRPDLRQLVQAALYTGCRYGELTGLTLNDIDLDKPSIYIQPSKSNKARHVPLTP